MKLAGAVLIAVLGTLTASASVSVLNENHNPWLVLLVYILLVCGMIAAVSIYAGVV